MQEICTPKTPTLSLSNAFLLLIRIQLLEIPITAPLALAGWALGPQYLPKPLVLAASALLAGAWIVRGHCARNSISVRMLAGSLALGPGLLLTAAFAVVGLQLVEAPLVNWALIQFPILRVDLDYGIQQAPWAAFLLIVVVAPLIEEFIFRGIMLRGLALHYGVRRGLLLGALLFALVHVYPVKLPGTFAAGLLLGWLLLRTGSVWPGVFAHALNNGICFVAMVKFQVPDPFDPGAWSFASLLAGSALLTLAYRLSRRIPAVGEDRLPGDPPAVRHQHLDDRHNVLNPSQAT